MTTHRSLLQTIIHGAAERLAQHPSVPPANREAFRVTAVHIIEQQIAAVVGTGQELNFRGWVMAPSARAERRARIVAGIHAGETDKQIAGRELCSPSLVKHYRAAARLDKSTP